MSDSARDTRRFGPMDTISKERVRLYPYQTEGAEWLASRPAGLLADDCGLGKSPQAITAAKHLKAETVVVLCPASVVENWKREFAKFWPGFTGAVVRSYDMAVRRGIDIPAFDVLIADEAHFLKSKDAKRTRCVFGERCDGVGGLVERAKNVFCLTGTPMPNNPGEIWPMLRALAPEAIEINGRPAAYWTFVNRFCRTEENYLGHIVIKGGKNIGDLKTRISPFMLRRKKDDVLPDLPPLTVSTLAIQHDASDSTLGSTEELRTVRAALERGGLDALAQIAPHVAQLRRATGLAKVGATARWIVDQLDGGMGKLVVFAHHRDVIVGLAGALRAADVKTVWIDGSVPQGERHEVVDRFQKDEKTQVFIGQITAAGTGITLTAASDLLFVESSWVPAENEQAAMRIHRLTQKNACMVRFATLAGSIDERIQEACARKMKDITEMFG